MHDNNDLFIDDEPIAPAFKPKAPGADCANCPLRSQPCVPSSKPDGVIRFAVVGEAPGAEEVSAGTPFVGQSGKLLRRAIEHVGLNPDEGFYTNAVLCRPPKNDIGPYHQAIIACNRRLEYEITAIDTNAIIAAGNTALVALDMVAERSKHGNTSKIHKSSG